MRAACPSIKLFIDQYGSGRYEVAKADSPFRALARSIAFQQLSGKAAGTIHRRFEALFLPDVPEPEQTTALGFEALRSCGLSSAKSLAILDLARHQEAGLLPSRRRMAGMSDGEITQRFTRVRGIGPWTVQMYLIFHLGRPDVMPPADLAIQKGVQSIFGLERLPSPKEVMSQTAHLSPFRSAAAWYLWRASEQKPESKAGLKRPG